MIYDDPKPTRRLKNGKVIHLMCQMLHCRNKINEIPGTGRPREYCCESCRKRHVAFLKKRRAAVEKAATVSSDQNFIFKCENVECGHSFTRKRRTKRFCSRECAMTSKRKQKKTYQTNRENFELMCHYTGTMFKSARSSARFKDKATSNKFFAEQRDLRLVTINENYYDDELRLEKDFINEIFIDCEFNNINFSGKDFTKARFIRCDFYDCDFTKTAFLGVKLIDCIMEGNNDFSYAFINMTDFAPNHEINRENALATGGRIQEIKTSMRKTVSEKMSIYDESY